LPILTKYLIYLEKKYRQNCQIYYWQLIWIHWSFHSDSNVKIGIKHLGNMHVLCENWKIDGLKGMGLDADIELKYTVIVKKN
jgi:hypothetical protein